MDVVEVTIIAGATVLGPIFAVQAQKWIERARENRAMRLRIFEWLMATRATRLAAEHVQSLNRIELAFRGKGRRDRRVRDAWRMYADKLNDSPTTAEGWATWASERDNLFIELLFAMSSALGFEFDRVQIRRGVYHPRGHGEVEERQTRILASIERLLSGGSIPVNMTASEEAAKLQRVLTEKMSLAYGEDGALRVRMTE